jgi:CPA2 family monovalent cation:H+ antiporter-2
MSFDYQFLINSLPYIAIASFSLILLKTTIIFLLCKLFRSSTANSLQTGLLLSQGGEFAFIVFLIAVQQKFINHSLSEFLMTTTTFTMALTPLLASLGIKLKNKININETIKHNKIKRELGDVSKHIVIIGFSKIGRIISYILRKKNINYLVLDNNPAIVKTEKGKGYNIYYGDALNLDILNHICIDKCESVVIAMDDEIARIKITRFLRKNFTDINIITNADSLNKAERLKKVGATSVVTKNLETALQLTSLAMVSAGIDIEDIHSTMSHLRELSSDTI